MTMKLLIKENNNRPTEQTVEYINKKIKSLGLEIIDDYSSHIMTSQQTD